MNNRTAKIVTITHFGYFFPISWNLMLCVIEAVRAPWSSASCSQPLINCHQLNTLCTIENDHGGKLYLLKIDIQCRVMITALSFDLDEAVKCITEHQFQRVVCQFPDEYLGCCTEVYFQLADKVPPDCDIFIAADSTFGSSVDDISAVRSRVSQ